MKLGAVERLTIELQEQIARDTIAQLLEMGIHFMVIAQELDRASKRFRKENLAMIINDPETLAILAQFQKNKNI